MYSEIEGFIVSEPEECQSWAASVVDDESTVYISAMTTGSSQPYAVEIGISDWQGKPLHNVRFNPKFNISSEATGLHGLTEKDVVYDDIFHSFFDEFTQIVTDKRVVLYNSNYDYLCIRNELDRMYSKTMPVHCGGGTHPYFFVWLSSTKARFDCFANRYGAWKRISPVSRRSYNWRLNSMSYRQSSVDTCRDMRDNVEIMALSDID